MGSSYPKAMRRCQEPGCRNRFMGGPAARYCPNCRWRHRARKLKWIWTPERDQILRDRYDGRVKGRAGEVARSLNFPRWAVAKRAAILGLSHAEHRKDWTPKEERFLWEHAGSRHVYWMAKQLRRTLTSVVLKLKRMRISRRWREGYTLRELELCFGCDHHAIDRWIKDGWLRGRRRGTHRTGPGGRGNGPADPWVFSDAGLLRFIQAHPLAFRLDKVDQLWFMDLVLNGAVIKRALEAEERLEAS